MTKKLVFLTMFLLFAGSTAVAQPANLGGIEGHVFDRRTLRPVSGITVQFTLVSGDTRTVSQLLYFDNPSGFYNILFGLDQTPLPGDASITAYCKLRTGKIVSSSVPLYSTPRLTIYRRDIYLDLPRSVKGCLPVDGAEPGHG